MPMFRPDRRGKGRFGIGFTFRRPHGVARGTHGKDRRQRRRIKGEVMKTSHWLVSIGLGLSLVGCGGMASDPASSEAASTGAAESELGTLVKTDKITGLQGSYT